MVFSYFRYQFSYGQEAECGNSWKQWFWNNIWPFGPSNNNNNNTAPDRPVLLVPGICGSMLDLQNIKDPKQTERVWVRLEDADSQFKKLWGKFNDSSGQIELFDKSLQVCVPDKPGSGGLYPIDILDPLWLGLTPSVLYYFHLMMHQFVKEYDFEAGKNLFGFGYDFRQSNRNHVDDLIKLLKKIKAQNNGKRIDLVSHSMGGLVVRCLLAEYPEIFEEYIENWICIACPFAGAPGFVMGALLNGASFVTGWESYFFVQRQTFLQMCIESPSLYEMLPKKWIGCPRDQNDDADDTPQTCVWIKDENGEPKFEKYDLSKFQNIQEKVLQGNQVTCNDETIELCQNLSCWEYAAQTMESWQKICWPESCKFYNIYGTGYETALSPTFGAKDKPLQNYTQVRSTEQVCFQTIDGDGTVPVVCSQADGLPAVERKAFKGLHRGLLNQTDVFNQVVSWLGYTKHDSNKNTQQTYQSTDGWILI